MKNIIENNSIFRLLSKIFEKRSYGFIFFYVYVLLKLYS